MAYIEPKSADLECRCQSSLAAKPTGVCLFGELSGRSTYDDLNNEHATETSHIDSTPSKVRENAEADQRTDDETRVDAHIEVERLCGVESGSL